MSNALLLRLFTSEFFNSWIAISYLFRYPDNVGIQHYLCNELKKFPNEEIEFFLPQLIHLLITRPSDSVALEYFLLEKFEQSSHIAVMSLWYFHAYLSDLSMTPNSPSFKLANRVSNKCQTIVFSDGSVGEEMETAASISLGIPTRRIRENIFPAAVGIGMMFAGIGQPLLTKQAGQIAIAQGRRNRALSTTQGLNTQTLTRRKTLSGPSVSTTDKTDGDEQTKDGDERNSSTESSEDMLTSLKSPLTISISPLSSSSQPNLVLPNRRSLNSHRSSTVPNSPSLDEISKGSKIFSVNRFIANGKSKQRPVSANFDTKGGAIVALAGDSLTLHHPPLPLTPSSTATSESESEASGAQTLQMLKPPKSPKSPRSLHRHRSEIAPKGLSTTITTRPHRSLLKSTYFKSEMQFLLTLVDIATRLVIVPKAARQSSLQAELTLLNHNLPAEVCIPMWCPGTGTTRVDPYRSGHHRVVRISPTDAVVLNSAERAPYLVLIEVLEGEVGEEGGSGEAAVQINERCENGEGEIEILTKENDVPINTEGGLQIKLETKDLKEYEKINEVEVFEAHVTDGESTLTIDQVTEKLDTNSQIADATLIKDSLILDSTLDVLVNDNSSAVGPIPQTSTSTPVTQSQPIPSPSISTTSSQPTPTVRRPSRSADEFAEQMRTAAIMLAQLQQQAKTVHPATSGKQATMQRQKTEEIRQRIIREMMALEETRMLKMKTEGVGSGVGGSGGEGAGGEMLEDEKRLVGFVDREDPSAAVFKENWEEKKNRIRAFSPYGHLPNWKLISVIVKNGADLRQEQLACQLIREIQRIWERAKLDIWLRYYRLLVTSESSGLIETIINSISIHSIKKDAYARRLNEKGVVYTLYDHFIRAYGEPTSPSFLKAQDNFMRSLAGYSIVCYVLNIKDRHNGNVLLGDDGHLIHIDYGFILSNSPGSVGFEMAPFKLPQEYLDVLGGVNGEKFAEFKALMKTGFLILRKNCENIVLLVEMMQKDSKLPCFLGGEATIAQLRDRFQLALTETQVEEYVDKLIISSACSIFTRLYDTFQYYSQGIL